MKTLLFLTTLVLSSTAIAHGDHPKPIAKCVAKCTKEEIQAAIPAALGTLVLKGNIEKDWTAGKIEGLELKTFKKGPEWVATVTNPVIKAHPKLFIFITTDGFLNGSNYNGN